MSKILKYSFSIEFLWHSRNSFSKKGVPKVSFYIVPSNSGEFDSVGIEILNTLFISYDKLKDIRYLNRVIDEILNVTQGRRSQVIIGNEAESLEIKKDLSRVIDGLDMYGSNPVDGENSWNISTPLHLQYIPTKEVLSFFVNWREFICYSDKVVLQNKIF